MKKNNEEFSIEAWQDHHGCRFSRNSRDMPCKTISTKLANVLERMPDVSWGILGDRFPAFMTFITVALITPLIILGVTIAIVLTLCELAFIFPLNYIVAFLIFMPIPLLLRSVELKAIRRELDTMMHPTMCNPNAVEEYKQLLNS